jgi:hypothetical protein
MAVSVTISDTRPVNTARSANLCAARARGGAATGGAAACLGGRAPTVPSSSAEATGLPQGPVAYARIPFARRIRPA